MRRKAELSWRDVDKRMRRAVKLRETGLSHRQIADRLAVSHATIRRDLVRFEQESVNKLLSSLEHMAGTYEPPASGMFQPYVPRDE
jgi:IS30 family transposase